MSYLIVGYKVNLKLSTKAQIKRALDSFLKYLKSWVWWNMSIIIGVKKLRQQDCQFPCLPGPQSQTLPQNEKVSIKEYVQTISVFSKNDFC